MDFRRAVVLTFYKLLPTSWETVNLGPLTRMLMLHDDLYNSKMSDVIQFPMSHVASEVR